MVRRLRNAAPIQSNKQEITWSNLAQDAGTAKTVVLAVGVKSADADAVTEVEIGHSVKFLYLEFQFSAETITNTKIIHWLVDCNISGATAGNPIQYYQPDRSFIIQRGMEMLPKSVNTIIKRIVPIRVPRVYQRAKNNWSLRFRYQASLTETINACGICIYKDKS